MLPRLIATDLDGTLLREDGEIDPRTLAALAALRARGVDTVACSARPARWMTQLAATGGMGGTMVCANGAVLWDFDTGALTDSFPLAPHDAHEVVQRLRDLVPDGAFAVEWVDTFGHEPSYRTRWPVGEDATVDDIETLLQTPPVKLLQRRRGGYEALARRVQDAVGDLVEVTWSDSTAQLLEMSAAGVSKGSGLAALCAARGVAREEVVAFGDMPNDISMLTWAGRGVAMGNAHPSVRAAADEVTLTNAEHGVALVLEDVLQQIG